MEDLVRRLTKTNIEEILSKVLICFYKLRDGYTSCTVFSQKSFNTEFKDLLKTHVEQILHHVRDNEKNKLRFSKRSIYVIVMELEKVLFDDTNKTLAMEFHFKFDLMDKKIEKFVVSNKLKKFFLNFCSEENLPNMVNVPVISTLSDIEDDVENPSFFKKMRGKYLTRDELDSKTSKIEKNRSKSQSPVVQGKTRKNSNIETSLTINLANHKRFVSNTENKSNNTMGDSNEYCKLIKSLSHSDSENWDKAMNENLLRGYYGHETNDLESMIGLHILRENGFLKKGSYTILEDRVILGESCGESFGDFIKGRNKWYMSLDNRFKVVRTDCRINKMDIGRHDIRFYDDWKMIK